MTAVTTEIEPTVEAAPEIEAYPEPLPSASPTRAREVVYVTGYGRSGSTILDIILGNARGVESVGELDLLHQDWNEHCCSCGEEYASCDFWSSTWQRVVDRIGLRAHEDLERNVRRVETLAALPALLLGWLPRSWKRAYREQTLAELDGISANRGCETILDSSKTARNAAGRALALERISGIEVKRIHLVRDGRAVLWSVKRGDNVRLGAGEAGSSAAFSFATLRAVFGWILANTIALVDAKFAKPDSTLVVRYEDLVTRPDEELERIGLFLGKDLTEVRRKIRDEEPLDVGHNTGGNRMRQGGAVKLRSDQEWESRLPRKDRAIFWALAWPLALKLGYGARSRPRAVDRAREFSGPSRPSS